MNAKKLISDLLSNKTHPFNEYKRFIIATDCEPDDLWAIWILILLCCLNDKEILIVVDQCGCTNNEMFYLMKCFLKETSLKNVKIVVGESTKSGFPPNFYGYNFEQILGDLKKIPAITDYITEMASFLKDDCFCLIMKPFPELFELMKKELIDFNKHCFAYYGSFNVRSQFPWTEYKDDSSLSKEENQKAADAYYKSFYGPYRDELKKLFEISGSKGTYYFETFLAFGDNNTVNSDSTNNLGDEFFKMVPEKMITICKEWNTHVYEDCIESMKGNLTKDEYELLATNGFDEKCLDEKKRYSCMVDAKIVRSIDKHKEKQIVFADFALVLSLLFFSEHYRAGDIDFVGQRNFVKFTPNDRSNIRVIQPYWKSRNETLDDDAKRKEEANLKEVYRIFQLELLKEIVDSTANTEC